MTVLKIQRYKDTKIQIYDICANGMKKAATEKTVTANPSGEMVDILDDRVAGGNSESDRVVDAHEADDTEHDDCDDGADVEDVREGEERLDGSLPVLDGT